MTGRTVILLCARWCRVCNDYEPLFDEVARLEPAAQFLKLDVEDDEALVGDIDVETFPTILVAEGIEVRFYGPVVPRADALLRVLRGTDAGGVGIAIPDEVRDLLVRMRSAAR